MRNSVSFKSPADQPSYFPCPRTGLLKNELKRGSSMVVREEDDGSLSIAPSSFPKKEKQDEAFINTSLNDNPDAIMRTAISAYLSGYNILHIRATGAKNTCPQNFETTSKALPETTWSELKL